MMSPVETQRWDSSSKWYGWTQAGLTEAPGDIPVQAVTVDLQQNQIEVIRENDFNQVKRCMELDISKNKIHTIENGAWNGLISLRELNLGYNQISVIRQNSFSHLSACEILNLESNKIHIIESGAWNSLSSLTSLALYGNEIEVLRPGMWSGLNNCEILWLDSNRIHTIKSGTFSDGLSNLKTLFLYENEIEEIKEDTFVGLTQCIMLYIFSNKIHTIHSGALEMMQSLTSLILHDNYLMTLHWTVFGKVPPEQLTISLQDNLLLCNNVSLCWIKQGEQQRWLTWSSGSEAESKDCIDTNMNWHNIEISCPHLGKYQYYIIISKNYIIISKYY